ncbi:MAG: AAA family ATPase [Nocardioidaceae bacterium]
MPILSAGDPLPSPPRRLLVSGAVGSGKSTLAARIGSILQLPYTELDSLHHGAGWVPRPEFMDDVRRLAASDRWVCEWQYPEARPVLAQRADTIVFLMLPRRVSFGRVLIRTFRRRFPRRQVLWNGNVEPPLRAIFTDPEHILRWHRHSFRSNRARHAEVVGSPGLDDLMVVELRTAGDVETWVSGPLARAARASGGSQTTS